MGGNRGSIRSAGAQHCVRRLVHWMFVAPAWRYFLIGCCEQYGSMWQYKHTYSLALNSDCFTKLLTCGVLKPGLQSLRAAMDVFLIECLCFISMAFILDVGNCLQMEQQLCDSSCAALSHHSYKRGVRYTYRYSTAITTTLEGSQSGRNGLALDCAVDIDVISNCHLLMQIRNPQIKRVSPQKEHSVQRLKSLREWLERSRLKFSLREGKVTALCPQEGGQLWTLNIQRAILSMLQTSRTNTKQETVKETDVYGTCSSRYERKGPVLLKTRDIQQCQQDRLSHFWPHSSTLTDDTTVDTKLQCTQRHGLTVMEEVNCTEVVSLVTLSGSPGVVKTQTVSTLVLLRAQEGTPSGADTLGPGVLTDLQFEVEGAQGPVRARASTSLEASDTVRRLCSLTSDQRQLSELFLHLAFQLRDLSLTQLRGLWQDASFKCRNDWQPLMDALPACGSEECILLLTDLIRDREIEQDQAHSYLSTLGLIPHPTPHIIHSINALLEVPEVRSKALLAGSSLIHLLCLRSPCSHIPQVQSFLLTLENILETDCEEKEPAQLTEVLYALKAVGNAGLAASALTPHLARCAQSPSAALDLRLAAIQAFRRIPCRADRGPLLQLYRSLQEDGEVRIAAYQQLMRCPDQEVFQVVKRTLSRETSSQVGSFVWSHLTHILRTEDPLKQALMEVLPDDIISRDLEAEPWKYSSYFDYTTDSGFGVANIEGSLVFSPKSFVPRSLMANLTVYVHGRAFNLLEVDLRAENIEPFLKRIFGHQPTSSDKQQTNPDREEADSKERKRRRRTAEGDEEGINDRRKSNDDDDRESQGGTDCLSSMYHYLHQARAMFAVGKPEENRPRCWVGVKVFGNELTMLTCDDLYTQVKQLSLNLAGMAVKLLKGQEVQLNHRAVLLTEEMVLPSLSGLPLRLSINMTSLLSLRLKGSANYRDPAHFSLAGYIKPNAYVGLSARVGVEGALGAAGVEWAAELRTSSSLDGSIYLQDGQSLRVTLNTPEDLMEVISLSSRLFHTSGDHREEIKGPKSRVEKTTCTPPKTWSKMVGWQLCYNISYPMSPMGISLPPPGPAHLSLRFLKLDRGLHQYLLEASYSLIHQKDSWLPSEASLHLLMATPQSTIPRDISLDLGLSPQRLVLKLTHPQKTIYIQGQLDQVRNTQTIQLDLLIDSVHHYYIMGLIDTQTVQLEQRLQYYLEAKMSPDGRPMILSANVTRGLGKKTSLSVALKNVFKETASFSVVLERRMDEERRQYSVEAELLLPGVVGSRILGLMEQKGSRWSSAVRLKYGLREESRHLHQECYTSQILRTDRDANQTYSVRAEHEFYCSNTASVNHKVLLRHEESPSHTRSSLDISYGKHWDEINNKRRLLISQSFRNQSRHTLTSYALEFSFQLPEKQLNYKTQLLHSHLRQRGAESSTHLKVNYNDHKPLVAGLHWKDASKATLRKLEATFNMDTPWLYIYTTHKLSQPQRHTLQLTSELTARKWLNIRSLVLEGLYMASSKEREARLHLYTPALTYLKARGWGMMGKQGFKASCSMSSLWSPGLRGDLSLETTKHSHTLQMASTYGKHNLTLTAALNTLDKNLRKRLVMVKVVFSEPKSPPMELEFEVGVEELLKEKMMYQKRAMLLLRQPFQNFLQNLQIQETFTVDLHKGLYILESKASLPGNREAIHTLTLGYQQPHLFVCSSLTHPFSSHTIPADSEVCVTVSSNQTQREVQGRVRVGKKNKLTFLGQVQSNPLDSPQHGLRVKASLSQLFQLQLPSSFIMEGDVSWNTDINSGFDYLARGKVGLGRQLCQFSMQFNGSSDTVGLYSSLSHPFKSKIPKTLEAQATAALFDPDGRASSTLHVRVDGKDRAVLEAQLAHSLQGGTTALGLHVNLTQSLLPSAAELFLNMSANISSHSLSMLGSYRQGREEMLAQVSGSLEHTPGLQVAVSGDLRHSLPSLTALPPALGLDGALGQSDTLTEGQLRVRVGEAVYSIELNHQEAPKDFQEAEEGTLGNELDGAHDWLCARAGEESLCLNISRKLRDQGRVRAQLSHASSWLHASGIPGNSSGQVSWTQEESRLAVLAELQAGSEALTAEFEGGSRDLAASQWELYSRLQHKIEALVQRGLPSSVQANAHYKMEIQEVSAGLSIEVEDQRKVHILVAGGRSNSTADLALSLWQQLRLLKGLVPSSLQMNCTGGVAEDRLSAQCSGSVAGQPMEVRAFRSHRPHSRLCYSLVLASPNLNTQAKGCYSPTGQTELRANLTHSSRLLRFTLGLPFNSSLRLLLRPGPTRWALGLGLSAGPWRGDLSGGLRLEAAGLYGWHGLVQYGSPSVSHKAEVRGRLRVESRCHLWADVSGVWDSVSSSLVVSSRCGGLTRVAWVKVWDGDAAGQSRNSMTILGRAGSDGLKGSLGLQNNRDSLHCLLSLVLKNQKAELGWTLQHQWASFSPTIPEKVDVHGSVQLQDASLSGSTRLSLDSRSAQLEVNAAWAPQLSIRASLQHSLPALKDAGIPEDVVVSVLAGSSQAQVELESAACAILAHGTLRKGGGGGGEKRSWSLTVRQRCVALKTLLPPQFSMNASLLHAACSARLDTHLYTGSKEQGFLSLATSCHPHLSLKGSARHSLGALRTLGVPSRGALVLALSTEGRAGVELGLELGPCYTWASAGEKGESEIRTDHSTWFVNVTHYCLALQDTVLPKFLVLQGLLSVAPCQLALSSALRVDNHDLNLELGQSCRPPRLSGTLTHSFPSLRIRGLPLSTSMEASAPGGVGQTGALLIKAGPCHIRARGTMGPKGRTKWSWASESECPLLQTLGLPSQAHLNGSVGQDDLNVWTAAVDAGVEGEQGSLRLTAGARPWLRLEGKLSHNLASLRTVPGEARLLVTGRAGVLGYDTEAQLQVGRCGVGASGTVMTGQHLQGVLVYHNNCTVLQEWGSPGTMTASGSLVINVTVLETQVSMAMDDKELQASMAVRTSEGQQEVSAQLNHSVPLLTRAGLPGNAVMAMLSENHGNGSYHQLLHCSIGRQQLTEVLTVERTAGMASVKSYLNHTISYLRNRGVPENNRIQLEVGAGEGKSLTLQSQFGDQQAGLGVRVRALALTMELQGHLRHSWRWLQERGLPLTVEALCSVRGPLPQMRSRARLSLDGHGLLASSLNISLAEGRLAMLFSLASPTSTSTGWQQSVDATLTAQLTGPLKSVLAEVRRSDKQLRLSGDLRGWGTRGGSREARVMLLHIVQGQANPALQVEAWGRLTDSQLRCSMAVNPKLSSSLALIVQGYHLKDSKELMVKVVQNIPELQPYLPVQLNARSQLNQSSSGVGALLELASGSRKLWALVDLAILEGGFRQAVELNHSFPQLKPRSVAVRTLYERGKWSHRLQHGTVYGGQEIRVAGLYSAPPHLELGDHSLSVQMAHVPRGSSLDVTLARSVQGSLDSVQLGWNRHGRLEQVKFMSSRNATSETSETRLELQQPFISTLSQLHIHTLSRSSAREQTSNLQTHLSWDSGVPMNVSLFLNKQWQNNSSKGQACGIFSPGLHAVVASPANIEGCVAVAQEGNSYSQNAVLKWGDRSVRQGLKYQRVPGGTDTLQLEAGADNVSPGPCSSHSLLAQVHTNLKDRLEHRLQLDLCPPHPSLVWSGDHRVNVGVELLYSQTRLSITGQPAYCSITLGLINSSNAHSTNLTLFAESTVGNWSAEVGGSALSSPLGPGVQIQARLDRSEQVWLRGALEGRCLQTAAGYHNAQGPDEDLSLAVCVEGRRRLTLKALRRKDGAEPVTLTAVILGIANHSLIFRATGCADDLWEVETQVHHLGSLLRVKLLERVQKLQHVLIVFRQQSRASKLLQELSAVPLRLTQRVEALLGQREGGAWGVWSSSHLRHTLADTLPRLLVLLEHISRLGQQELKRPLATLAGAYHDVTGQRMEAVWRGAVEVQMAKLMELLSPVLQSHQLRLLAQTGLVTLGTGLDLLSQQTAHWVEARLAASLSGLRRRLASIYRLSPSQCSVSVTVPLPLPRGSWSRVTEAGLMEVLLEEGLLKPLQALSSVRPTAELYRLKRRIMDSPFGHQALLVADQFGVTFDGHLFELPAHCPLLLAHDIYDSSFTVLLNTEDSLHTLVVASNNSTTTIHQNGQVKVNCHGIQTSYSDNGLVIKKDSNFVEVSNQDGMSVSCDSLFGVCSITLDGWLHGVSSGLLGTNDNEAGNDFTFPDGLQADNIADFVHSWQVRPECGGEPTLAEPCSKMASDPVSCNFLFSAPDSPLGSCFRVVDPAQFLKVCERSHCGSVLGPSRGPCSLAAAFVHICQRNYVPLELPVQCFAL